MQNVIRTSEDHMRYLIDNKLVSRNEDFTPEVKYKVIHSLDHYMSMPEIIEVNGKTYHKVMGQIFQPSGCKGIFAQYRLVR